MIQQKLCICQKILNHELNNKTVTSPISISKNNLSSAICNLFVISLNCPTYKATDFGNELVIIAWKKFEHR